MDEQNILVKNPKYAEVEANAINRFMFWYLIIGLFFGVLFYDFISNHLGFTYIDEILAFSFCFFTLFVIIHDPNRKFGSYWLWLFGIFTFYLLYSFTIHSNSKFAIIQDAIVEIKPFLGFFCAYFIGVEFTARQKRIIQIACFAGIAYLLFTTYDIFYYMGHPSRYATAATFIAFLFLFVSDFTKKNLVIFWLLLIVAIFSGRAKAFGFIVLVSALSVFYYNNIRFKFSLKYLLIGVVVLTLIILVAWQKIDYYFVYGVENLEKNEVEDAFARPAMYWGFWQILCDKPFLGSGFASFGTYFSSIYYSDTYYEYGLDKVFGLSEKMPDFMADTYYPSLAQYGFVGVILFVYFWIFVLKKVSRHRLVNDIESNKYAFIVVSIVVFFAIESIADTTFTHNRGLFMTILMGLSCAKVKLSDRITN